MTESKCRYHGIMDPPQYDGVIHMIIPHHPALLRTVIEFVPDTPSRILELGCGTGILTAMLRATFPGAETTGLDISGEMLALASEKPELAGTRFIEGDIRGEWPDGMYDAIISTLCLHHISRDERSEVIRRAAGALNPGGRFIYGDIFRAEQDWEDALLMDGWRKAMRTAGAPEEVIVEMTAQRKERAPMLSTMPWAREQMYNAGFTWVMDVFCAGFVGLLVGIR